MPVPPVTPAASRSTPSRATCSFSSFVIRHLPALRSSDRSAVGSHGTHHSSQPRDKSRGFTLLELLVVIGIIAILAGIVLGVGRRASESGKIARAKAEMAALSTALEAYKSQYGDYPQTNNADRLLQSLIGKVGPLPTSPALNGRALIETAKFRTLNNADPFTNAAAVLIDPWDQPYVYSYNTFASGWRNSSFVLYSIGPDGLFTAVPATGLIDVAAAGNADNLYANRN